MAGFEDLAEIVFGKDHCVFLFGAFQGGPSNVQKIGADGQMRPMLFQDANGKHTGILRLLNGSDEIAGGQLVPSDRQRLRGEGQGKKNEKKTGGHDELFYRPNQKWIFSASWT